MPRVGFEPTISAAERPQTYVLDRAASGTGLVNILTNKIHYVKYIKTQMIKHASC